VPTAEEMQQWEAEISRAETMRTRQPEAMDVMAPRIPKGKFVIHLPYRSDPHLSSAPTLAEKRLELLKELERGVAGETAWMITGLKLEEHQ
jgi:hypothetical protein